MQDDKGNHLKAARFLKMLEPFLELRNVWRRHAGFKDRKALLAFFERKRHSTLTKKELFPSMHFDVNEAVTLGFGLPITLEDSFTLIHQETLIALNVVNKDLKQIIEKYYPPLLQQLNNQCNHIARGSFIYTTPPTIIDVTSKKISITKVLPLRSHAAILKIQYNCKTGITSVKFSIFGGNDNNRWEHLAVDSEINLRLGDFHFVNKPHFGEQKENFSFEVKIDSIKQIEQLIETIENCIATSYTIADDPGVDINQALHSTYIMRANQIDKLLTLKPELKHSYIDRQILTLQLIKKRASFITHREYFFNLNSNQIEYLCNKVNLTVQVLSKIYYTKLGIIEFLIKNVKEIGTLSEAGFPLKSLLNNENITLEKLQLFVKNSNQIEYFCNKEDFTPQELLKIAPDVVQLLINKVKEIVTLSKTGFPLKSLLNNENITLEKLQLFVKNSNQIEYLHTAGAVPQVLLDMCINRANHFEYIMTNGPEILILSSLGFPIQELFKDNDINKVKFFIDNSYAIDALDKEVKLTLGKMLEIYNSNVNKAKFLTNNYFGIIEILSNTDLTLPEILVTYDSNVNKAEFLIDNYMEILILSDKTNFTIQYVSKIYDNDPGCAKLITNNENKIEDILQEGILTAEDLINCNSSQLTELIKDKITAIQLKASLTQNVQESKNNTAQITKSLKTKAVEIGNAVPLAAITITPSTNIQNIGIKQKGLIAHHGSLMNKK
ncbi:hypothetical protein [Candidatus Tisiphia endosymbiont of Beris chalybata]|uniref:hypothetical protein n=1 Tax=Candidatus Tisiphia endosymbiont of Beris chalybata TaxID=3066262 RepID=UPI00312C9588